MYKNYFVVFCFLLLLVFLSNFIYGEEVISPGPFTTWTAPLCGKGVLVAQPFFFYTSARGSFDDDGKYHSIPEGEKKRQIQEQLFLYYGLTERLEIDAQLTYQHNYVKQEDLKAHAHGLADTYLFLRYLLKEEDKFPCVTSLFQIKLPTAKYKNLDEDKLGTDALGNGVYEPGMGLIATKNLKPFIVHFDTIYTHPLERKIEGIKTLYGQGLNLDFAIEYLLPKGFNLMFELNGVMQKDRRENGEKIPASDIRYLMFSSGIGWASEKFQMLFGYQRTFIGKNTEVNDSLVLTFVYTF
ncbi:MAG: transporter [Candidatus Omnitrophica bacterium]|nr:transporter [Candidatus Omnitrophota bacterium]